MAGKKSEKPAEIGYSDPEAAESVATQAGVAGTKPQTDEVATDTASVVAFAASIYPKDRELPKAFVEAVQLLEAAVGTPVWFIVQDGGDEEHYDSISRTVRRGFYSSAHEFEEGQRVALLIDSHGGLGIEAYRIAKHLIRRCGEFTAVIPRHAKSAATLLTLGAKAILMGERAELGPLDGQVYEYDREDWMSALDEVQALERINTVALEVMDSTLVHLASRTRKRTELILPSVCTIVSGFIRPLLEKVDLVHYTQMARYLKEAEEYARRLLMCHFDEDKASEIADRLVGSYPGHDFVIDREEVDDIGLKRIDPDNKQKEALHRLRGCLPGLTAIGQLEEAYNDEK